MVVFGVDVGLMIVCILFLMHDDRLGLGRDMMGGVLGLMESTFPYCGFFLLRLYL
jgi:hypothetical protein